MHASEKSHNLAIVAASITLLGSLVLDLNTTLGVASGVLYVIAVLIGGWFRDSLAAIYLAVIGSGLVITAYLISPGGSMGWVVLTNCGYTILAIWVSAVLVWSLKKDAIAIKSPRSGWSYRLLLVREGVVVAALGFVIAVGAYGVISIVERNAKSGLGLFLDSALHSSHTAVRNHLARQLASVELWAESDLVITAAETLQKLPRQRQLLISSTMQKNLREIISPVYRNIGFRGFFIIGKDNINLASSRDANIGSINLLAEQEGVLERLWQGESVFSLPQISDVMLENKEGKQEEGLPTMFVAAPIKDAKNNVVAILSFRLDPDESFASAFSRTRIGSSGETYAFDRNGLLISKIRFEDVLRQVGVFKGARAELELEIRDPGVNLYQASKLILPPEQRPHTLMVKSAISGRSDSNLDGYRDYRGVTVVGAWLWDQRFGFGIATEVDVEEAYTSLNSMKVAVYLFATLAIGILIFWAVVSVNSRRKIESASQQNELLLTSAGEGIYEVDANGRTTFVNPAACTMLGYEESELLGKSMHELVHHSYPDGTEYPREYCLMYAPFLDGNSRQVENEVLWRKDGSSFPVEYSSTPIVEKNKNIGVVVTFRDIETRRRAEEQVLSVMEERETLLNSSPAGICFFKNRQVLNANPHMLELFGMTEEELIGQHAGKLYPSEEDYEEFGRILYPQLVTGKVVVIEQLMRRKNGSCFMCQITSRFIDASNPDKGAIAIVEDITERKEVEEKLKISQETADKANRAKSEFLSSMSHELRTPLNAILGFGQMLSLDPDSPLSESQQESVHHIMKGGEHLLELINEILDLAKIESAGAGLSIEGFSPWAVLSDSLPLVQTMADKRGITIVVEESCNQEVEIRADQTRFKQSLLNLLSNAVKYNRENGRIVIAFQKLDTGMLRVSVSDTGEGIPEDELSELFQPFHRLRHHNHEVEGTGIGLTITKELVEQMNGSIGVKSIEGKGSNFWIELPLFEESKQSDNKKTPSAVFKKDNPQVAARGKLLFVEDNPTNLKLMDLIVRPLEDVSMISAHNAELGLELARLENPDLIILDINLPGMDGIEAVKRLKQMERTQDIPVVALSANAMPSDIEKALSAGFVEYLTKPIDVTELLELIKNFIGHKSS